MTQKDGYVEAESNRRNGELQFLFFDREIGEIILTYCGE